MSDPTALTPMMQQYQRIRCGLPEGTLLLFRLGDFYEMFFDDAKDASALLNVALTKRNGTPMCGVPCHAVDGYVRRLVKAGRRVAICDQVSEPQPGRIVDREVSRIISPGTVADTLMLDARRPNFLAAICGGDGGLIGLAFLDLTTGDFRVTEVATETELQDELARVEPAEVLVSEEERDRWAHLAGVTPRDGYTFLLDQAVHTLREHFGVHSLDGFGCTDLRPAVCAAGAIVHYVKQELRRSLTHLTHLQCYQRTGFLVLDATTQGNLELVEARGGGRDTSLLSALDRTHTPMGARRLRDWILHPLCTRGPIEARQEMIGALLESPERLGHVQETLRSIRDVERTVGRLAQTGGSGRDLLVLQAALEQVPALQADVAALPPCTLRDLLLADLHPLPHLVELLGRAVVEEPPATTREGGIFRDGYSPALDELRIAGREGKDWVAQLQQRAMEETGIRSLKVRFTSVFGYFIEVTKSNLHLVPPHWHRKQTVATGERFITPELKEVEAKILGADDRARALEGELFIQLRDEVLTDLAPLQATAHAVGTLDVLASLAQTARLFGYCRPRITEGLGIRISDGRHPVLDQSLVEEKFVPNDVTLDAEENRLLILTGPNMAGKSTYIRQVALLVLLAQTGSWIPAREAEIGLVDRIFTRVGANDDLSRGQSTFMVEMCETANITHNATARSLVILDEIGRGTSTFDGLSIAWSVAEFLHDRVGARTLFATHYHELIDLARTRAGVKNFNVAVREWNDQIIFLRKIVPGGADKSYGIQVARLAGLPPEVIARAKTILANLEQHELTADGQPTLAESAPVAPSKPMRRNAVMEDPRPQLTLF